MKRLSWLLLWTVVSFAQVDPTGLYMVGNAHIDMAYRWRWNETVDRVVPDTFWGVLKTMQAEPDLTFAQSQMVLYETMQIYYPDLFKAIKEKIKEGKWSVVGGQWVEPDAILPGGESLIRQFLIGKEYAASELGVDSIDVAWVPDSFCGQALTLPMIYSGCGMKTYVFSRGAPQDKRVFWWESPDGSRILAYNVPIHYNIKPTPDIMLKLKEWFMVANTDKAMLLYGEGDHGGGPRMGDVENIRRLQQESDFPDVYYSTPERFLDGLLESEQPWPVHRGEIGIGTGEDGKADTTKWRGSYTSQARLKKRNRQSENLLLAAEKFATIGSMLQRKPLFPRVDFRQVWKKALFNQFHDILPGTCIGDAADDALIDYNAIESEGYRLLQFGLEVIGSRIDTRGRGIPLVVYNPVSWTRSHVVDADIRFPTAPEDLNISDEQGNRVLFYVKGWSQDGLTAYASLYATGVPAMGYKLYRVYNEEKNPAELEIKVGTDMVQNEYLVVRYDNTGVTSIYDKRLQREILSGTGNVLQLIQESSSSSWDLSLTNLTIPLRQVGEARIVERTPLRVVVEWGDKSEQSYFNRRMILNTGSPQVDFEMNVDWHDSDRLLKVVFPVNVMQGKAFYEQPYGYIQRHTDGQEWVAQNWVALSTDAHGVALLNDGKYGFDIRDNVMRMSVVRGARDMDPRMDEGVHPFRYALYSHAGDWREGDVPRAAMELNQPMIPMQEPMHDGALPNWARKNDWSLPAEHSFFGCNSDHVVVSALKVQQGDWSPHNVILRLFETEGRDDRVTVTLPAPARSVVETNHIEEVLSDQPEIRISKNRFTVDIGHHQVRTFMIEF